MEAIAALGVISSVISVVDLAGQLVVTTKDLVHSANDALPQNAWLEELATRHKSLANDLQQTTSGVGPLGKTDADLAQLAHRCLEESSDLLKVLQKLKVPTREDGTKSKLSALKAVVKTMYKNGEIDSKRKKLADLESQLSVMLLHAIQTSQLAGFDELRNIVENHGRDAVTVVRESRVAIVDKIRQLQNSLSHVEQGVDRIEQRQLNAQEQQRVADLLSSLAYENMKSRKEIIVDPVGSTFDWAFEDDKQPLQQWLDGALTHCWVSGDPGTGKSVFMKSLCLDPRTSSALQAWAGTDRLLMLDHYFWIAGTAMQRSWRAMLQHLCYEVIEQYNDLAQRAFPAQWNDPMSLRGRSWTIAMLIEALKRIIAAPRVKVCIILDGLDECDDRDRKEMVRTINEFVDQGNIKLCVSSRPWIEFEKSFQTWSRVDLPENTKWDIFQLVCERLRSADEPTYQDCANDLLLFDKISALGELTHEVQALATPKRLIYDICRKANGITLWANLVLDTICERLSSDENLEQLSRFIDEVPAGLDDYYFQLVYSRIHETYRTGKVSETAMILKIVCLQSTLLGVGLWALLNSLRSTGGIAYDHRFAISYPVTEDETVCTHEAHSATRAFVTSRCKGLLTTSTFEKSRHRLPKVAFTHRSIDDFVHSTRMQALLDTQIPEHFKHPDFALQLMLLSAIMVLPIYVGSGRNQTRANTTLSLLYLSFRKYRLMGWPASDEHSASVFNACDNAGTLWVQRYATHLSNQLRQTMLMWSLELACASCTRTLDELVLIGLREDVSHVAAITSASLLSFLHSFGMYDMRFRQVIACHQAVPGKPGASNLPAVATVFMPVDETWFMAILRLSLRRSISKQSWEVLTPLIRTFLQAGASLDLDLCVGASRCLGLRCVCAKSRVHTQMYECPGGGIRNHVHHWRPARSIVLEYTSISEEELDKIIHSRRGAEDDAVHQRLLANADKVEAEWQRIKLCDDLECRVL